MPLWVLFVSCLQASSMVTRSFSSDFKVVHRKEPIDPQTASIYRDTLLADEAGHEWLAPEILKRYAQMRGRNSDV